MRIISTTMILLATAAVGCQKADNLSESDQKPVRQPAGQAADSISARQEVDGSSLAAAAVTKGKRDKDAATMLAEIFQGFPANCLSLKTGPLRTGSADANGKTDLTVPVTITVDPKRYQAFDSTVRRLLGKMAVRQKSYPLTATDLLGHTRDQVHGNRVFAFHEGFAQPDGVRLYSFLDLEDEGGLSRMHFGKPRNNIGKAFGVALYDTDRSTPQKTYWSVFELSYDYQDFFRKHGRFRYDTTFSQTKRNTQVPLNMSIRLVDAGNNPLAAEEFIPDFVQSRSVPMPGTTDRPPVVLEGVQNDPEDQARHIEVTLDLVNLGMTEDDCVTYGMEAAIRGERSYQEQWIPMFSIAPLFRYSFPSNDAHAHSPEVRLAVTFKGLEVAAIEKIKKVDCSVSVVEQAREGGSQ